MIGIENHGSIALLRPTADDALAFEGWVTDNVAGDHQFFGSALVVEPRYLEDVVLALAEVGFTVAAS